MELRRAFRFELDPNNVTLTLLRKHAGAARFAWNWSLARRIERFKAEEGKLKFTNAIEEHRELNKLKGTDFPWMYEVSKCAPQEALRNLDKAFKNFWARRKDGAGFPKFKKKYLSKDSFRLTGSIEVQDRYVKLPRLGVLRVKEKIVGRVTGKILSATISREADCWFVALNTVSEVKDPEPVSGPACGIDFGISTFATLSSNHVTKKITAPNPLKSSLARLARAQRNHSRKKKGSNNRRKSAQKIARIHARIANVRKDFVHKFTTELAKTKSCIGVEDLNVQGMSRNHTLARSILDQGWGEARRQLEYKTKWYGSKLVVADRFFPSSKLCSNCGLKRAKLSLNIRSWTCEGCNTLHDRDENAAKNLEDVAYREFLGNGSSEQKPVEIPLTAERRGFRSTSHGSLKQEANTGAASW
jgi:putative transposase